MQGKTQRRRDKSRLLAEPTRQWFHQYNFNLHVSELVGDGKGAAQSAVLYYWTTSMRIAHRSELGESCVTDKTSNKIISHPETKICYTPNRDLDWQFES